MADSAHPRSAAFRKIVVPLALLVAAPLGAGETTIFEDGFDLAECSMWSSTSNPVAYPDLDEDSWGDTTQPTVYCELPAGFVLVDGDCDDGDDGVNPDAVEVCDGADNDCNPSTLDGDAEGWLGGACDGSDSDACTDGMYVCASASQFCSDSGEENLEVCNGADDDCDSFADEDFECVQSEVGQCGVTDVGDCQYGTRTCSGECSWGSCSGNVDPEPEICDDHDNNCDGQTDEGDPGGGADCDTGMLGICSAGIQHCVNGGLTCVPLNEPGPEEICGDGLDNDCDGLTGEGCGG